MDERRTTPCKALVLAGGGARGSYQVGVWRALMELGWHPQIITGTSVGSLNGAMFVLDQYETARDMWLAIRSKDVMELPAEDADAFGPARSSSQRGESRRHGCDPAGRDRGAGAGRRCPARGSHPLWALLRWSSGA